MLILFYVYLSLAFLTLGCIVAEIFVVKNKNTKFTTWWRKHVIGNDHHI